MVVLNVDMDSRRDIALVSKEDRTDSQSRSKSKSFESTRNSAAVDYSSNEFHRRIVSNEVSTNGVPNIAVSANGVSCYNYYHDLYK